MSARVRSAIARGLKSHPAVTSAWGFGSFFRGERHHDIDLLLVVAVPKHRLLDTARELRAAMLEVENTIGVPIDPLILTETEFKSRPLRDMCDLVRITGNT
jgi:predicted nucleotidyltransferase